MEKKYTLQDLAALLAERESLPLEQAEDFVRSFFELTEEGLLKDSFVKVTGFGTFKLVEVSERESVNINTGERFQISGHNKISFTPDGTLRELVNRPFAHFTTVTLNDKTPEAALEEAERPLAEESTESSATSSHTPLPAPENPIASSPSCETNTTAPAEEEQQPDAATEKAEENVVPAVEETIRPDFRPRHRNYRSPHPRSFSRTSPRRGKKQPVRFYCPCSYHHFFAASTPHPRSHYRRRPTRFSNSDARTQQRATL